MSASAKRQTKDKATHNTGKIKGSQHENQKSVMISNYQELLRRHQEIISKEVATISVKISKSYSKSHKPKRQYTQASDTISSNT